MNFLEKLLVGIISSAIMFCLIGALTWFGVPRVWRYLADGEVARQQVVQLQATLATERQASKDSDTACDARLASNMKAAAVIAKASAPRLSPAGSAQPVLTASDIASVIQ